MHLHFSEEQRFNQPVIWIIQTGVILLIIFLGLWKPGYQALSPAEWAILMAAVLLPILLLRAIRLTTEIDDKQIRWQFFPFVKKQVSWQDVETASVVDYGFVGGWGIRLFTRYGTVYNVRGRMGLALTLKNGKKLLIGTQEPDRLRDLVKKIKP